MRRRSLSLSLSLFRLVVVLKGRRKENRSHVQGSPDKGPDPSEAPDFRVPLESLRLRPLSRQTHGARRLECLSQTPKMQARANVCGKRGPNIHQNKGHPAACPAEFGRMYGSLSKSEAQSVAFLLVSPPQSASSSHGLPFAPFALNRDTMVPSKTFHRTSPIKHSQPEKTNI